MARIFTANDPRHRYVWSAQYADGTWHHQFDAQLTEQSIAQLDQSQIQTVILSPVRLGLPTIHVHVNLAAGERVTKCWTVDVHSIRGETVFETLGLEDTEGNTLPVHCYVDGETVILASSYPSQ